MGPFRGESKDGFGLNPCESDCGTSGPTKYYGEDFIREKVQLAPNAVVYLHRLCYASGNAESGMAPVFNKDLATERASNFASGFLDAGAAAVFALGWRQKLNLPQHARHDRQDHGRDLHDPRRPTAAGTTASRAGTTTTARPPAPRAPGSISIRTSATATCGPSPATWR